jgi:hypothetical protein
MTKYTDTEGNQTILCDQCRQDINVGEKAFTISPGIIADGYVKRDYDKGEMALCSSCAQSLGRVLAITGTRYADNLLALKVA